MDAEFCKDCKKHFAIYNGDDIREPNLCCIDYIDNAVLNEGWRISINKKLVKLIKNCSDIKKNINYNAKISYTIVKLKKVNKELIEEFKKIKLEEYQCQFYFEHQMNEWNKK